MLIIDFFILRITFSQQKTECIKYQQEKNVRIQSVTCNGGFIYEIKLFGPSQVF